jgi:hypothetical protein
MPFAQQTFAVIVCPDESFLIPAKIVISDPLISFDTAIDALIVAIETQHVYLSSRRTWTRKIVILTDGESPIELDEWENTAQAVNDRNIILTVVYVLIALLYPSLDAHFFPAELTSTKIPTTSSVCSRTNPTSR